MLAALLVALSVSAPATLTSAALPEAPILETTTLASSAAPLAKQLLQVDPNAPDHEASFTEKYLSFQLSPLASQQAKDGLLLSHIIGYLAYGLCGTLWGPLVAVEGAEFTGDVAITWLLSNIIWFVIASVATAVTFGVGGVMFVALPYLSTTSVLNEIDRGIKKKGLAGGPARRPGSTPTPTTPPSTVDTPPPSYAY